MVKSRTLVSPFGELTLRIEADHAHIVAPDRRAGDWGLGWWHAQQSGDEAVFERSLWRGELGSEPRPSLGRTELDAFIDQWGFKTDLPLETNRLPAGLRARVQAYAQGFNQSRRRKPREALWTPDDCHLLARTMGFLEWWETRAPQIAFLIEAWQAGLSWAQILDLWPGLGPEPDQGPWAGVRIPPPFSPEARALIDRVRRFRRGPVWLVPPSRSASGRPLLGACYVSDVTDPGLPFLPVRIDSPEGEIRGLSRPGHPGLLAGRTSTLAWHVTPAVDDCIDLRRIDRGQGTTLAGVWAGTGKTGTLEGLMAMEEVTHVDLAQERTQGLGSACLDFAAVDSAGGWALWAQGPQWLRPSPRDALLPAPWESEVRVGVRHHLETMDSPSLGRVTPAALEALLSQTRSDLPESVLSTLRFLLPDTEEGRRLRKWTGSPEVGPEAALFERLYAAVLEEFWAPSPRIPTPDSAISQALAPVIDRLIQAPHSAWFPSHDKNHRLAEAVRRAFAPGPSPGRPLLGRRSPKPCWTEALGGKPRIFASTVALVVDPGTPTWSLFHTDDETEIPGFRIW